MSRLKSLYLFLLPVYLKIRGRVMGRFCKLTAALYIGLALLTIASMTLLVVLANFQGDFGGVVRPEQEIVGRTVPLQKSPAIIDSSPALAAETVEVSKNDPRDPRDSRNLEEPKELRGQPNERKTILVMQQGRIQLDFGWQNHPVYKDWRYHTGVDIAGHTGQSVYAIHPGKVTAIFRDRHNGLTLAVKDNLYTIYYGSLSEVNTTVGSVIDANQVLGKMGHCDEEPYEHLHLAIKKGDKYVDPKVVVANEWTKN